MMGRDYVGQNRIVGVSSDAGPHFICDIAFANLSAFDTAISNPGTSLPAPMQLRFRRGLS